MKQTITAYEGTTFTVDLQSMLSSTNYGWCLKDLPSGILLLGSELLTASSDANEIGPVIQRFYFGVSSAKPPYTVKLKFVLACYSNVKDTRDKASIKVQTNPANEAPAESGPFVSGNDTCANGPFVSDNGTCANGPFVSTYAVPAGGPFVSKKKKAAEKGPFVSYSENAATNAITDYGFPYAGKKYGYPCTNVTIPYGVFDTCNYNLKYGYPCSTAAGMYAMVDSTSGSPVLKYGYPLVKYGYPCFTAPADAAYKYGYPMC